jgi:hypothetical protein
MIAGRNGRNTTGTARDHEIADADRNSVETFTSTVPESLISNIASYDSVSAGSRPAQLSVP